MYEFQTWDSVPRLAFGLHWNSSKQLSAGLWGCSLRVQGRDSFLCFGVVLVRALVAAPWATSGRQ